MQPLSGLHEHSVSRPVGHSRRCFWWLIVTFRGFVGCWESSLASGGVERRNFDPAGLAVLLRVGRCFVEVGAVTGVAAYDQLLGGVERRASTPATRDGRGGCRGDAQAAGPRGVPTDAP